MRSGLSYLLILFTIIFAKPLLAETHSVGDYTIHYSLMNSSFIQPETAKLYNLKRSKNIALLNISVMKKSNNEMDDPVIANLFGHATNLVGQLKKLAFKEIKEDKAIYYIASFPITNGENLKFELQVQPNKQGKIIPLSFRNQLFIN